MELHPGAMEASSGSIVAHHGVVEDQPEAWGVTIELWRLTLEQVRNTMEQ